MLFGQAGVIGIVPPSYTNNIPGVVNFALDRLTDSGIDNLQLVATGVPANGSNGQSLVCWHFSGAVDVT